MIDLTIAVVIGAAFGKVVSSLVDNVLMPPLGCFLVKWILLTYSGISAVRPSSRWLKPKKAGIPVIAYGMFINDIISFLLVALAVFVIVKQFNRFKKEEAATTKDCPQCCSSIPLAAKRCRKCTSELAA